MAGIELTEIAGSFVPDNTLDVHDLVNKMKVGRDAVSVIISYRNRRATLDAQINFLLQQTNVELEIVVVESDKQQTLPPVWPDSRVKIHFVHGDDKFSKGQCTNYGVSVATHNKLCLHDVDIIVPVTYLCLGASLLDWYQCGAVISDVFYLPNVPAGFDDIQPPIDRWRNTYAVTGMSAFITKDAYIDIGGFDETYCGWGFEDIEFMHRMKGCLRFFNSRFVPVFHMWHQDASRACVEANHLRWKNCQYTPAIQRASALSQLYRATYCAGDNTQ